MLGRIQGGSSVLWKILLGGQKPQKPSFACSQYQSVVSVEPYKCLTTVMLLLRCPQRGSPGGCRKYCRAPAKGTWASDVTGQSSTPPRWSLAHQRHLGDCRAERHPVVRGCQSSPLPLLYISQCCIGSTLKLLVEKPLKKNKCVSRVCE